MACVEIFSFDTAVFKNYDFSYLRKGEWEKE